MRCHSCGLHSGSWDRILQSRDLYKTSPGGPSFKPRGGKNVAEMRPPRRSNGVAGGQRLMAVCARILLFCLTDRLEAESNGSVIPYSFLEGTNDSKLLLPLERHHFMYVHPLSVPQASSVPKIIRVWPVVLTLGHAGFCGLRSISRSDKR